MNVTETRGESSVACAVGGSGWGDRLGPRAVLLLVGILVVAAGLRVYALGRSSFWCDEFLTAEMAMGRGYAHEKIPTNRIVEHPPALTDPTHAAGIAGIWKHQVDEGYPPFYVVVARCWETAFGASDIALRALSVALSVAAVFFLFDAVRVVRGVGPGLWAAAIAAVAGPQIAFAQEARGYTLLMMAGAGALGAMARLEKRGAGVMRATALGGACLALLLTHYYTWGAVGALGLYAAVRLRGQARHYGVIAVGTAALICAVSWGPFMARQIDASHVAAVQYYFGDAKAGRIGRLALRLALLPVRYLYEPMGRTYAIAAIGAVAYLLVGWVGWRHRDLRLWAIWSGAIIAPVALVDLCASTAQLGMIRYTLPASIGLYAALAAGLDARRRAVAVAIPVVTVLACLLSIQTVYVPWKANWRAVAADWARTARPGETTLFVGSEVRGPYSPSLTYVSTSFYHRANGPIVILRRPANAQLIDQLKRSKGVVMVASAGARDPESFLPGAKFVRTGFEPYVAKVYRVRWPVRASASHP